MTNRLPFTTFQFPVEEIRCGYYSAVYFLREKRILEKEMPDTRGLMQVFNKVDGATVCGIDESLALLRLCAGQWRDNALADALFRDYLELKRDYRTCLDRRDWRQAHFLSNQMFEKQRQLEDMWVDRHQELEVHALKDGDQGNAYEAVMLIEGPGSVFAHLESVYLGVLARATRVATNTRQVVEAAQGKPVLFFADRFDRWQNQTADGYAAMKAGAFRVASNAMGEWWGMNGFGTTPHALIAFFGGDTAQASLAFSRYYPNVNNVALVDFHNDCVGTSLAVAREFERQGVPLWGVRLDTSGTNVDKSIMNDLGNFKPTGVCPKLVEKARAALDQAGFGHIRIVASGGFGPEKISSFESMGVPVDAYGVGSSLLAGNYDHTADIVEVEKQPMAKAGRSKNPGPGLHKVEWSDIEPDE